MSSSRESIEINPEDRTSYALGLLRQIKLTMDDVADSGPEEIEATAEAILEENNYSDEDKYPVLAGVYSADVELSQKQADRAREKLETVIDLLELEEEEGSA